MQDVEFALDYIQREDPSVHVHVDEETGQTLLSGVCLCLCLCACVCVCVSVSVSVCLCVRVSVNE